MPFYIYILTTKYNQTLYVRVTTELMGRVNQHIHKELKGFTSKYNIGKLVHYEVYDRLNLLHHNS